jgi:hypothetical protein
MNLISEEKRDQESTAKKTLYNRPSITTFGSVAKLTQGVGGTHQDVGQGGNTRRGA